MYLYKCIFIYKHTCIYTRMYQCIQTCPYLIKTHMHVFAQMDAMSIHIYKFINMHLNVYFWNFAQNFLAALLFIKFKPVKFAFCTPYCMWMREALQSRNLKKKISLYFQSTKSGVHPSFCLLFDQSLVHSNSFPFLVIHSVQIF